MNLTTCLKRFFTGSAAGAALDFSLAAVLTNLGVSLITSCATGLACAVSLTYWIHLRWTFRVTKARFLSPHLLKFSTSSFLTFGVRVAIIEIGYAYIENPAYCQVTLLLGAAIGVSFCINFLLSALWAFAGPTVPYTGRFLNK